MGVSVGVETGTNDGGAVGDAAGLPVYAVGVSVGVETGIFVGTASGICVGKIEGAGRSLPHLADPSKGIAYAH